MAGTVPNGIDKHRDNVAAAARWRGLLATAQTLAAGLEAPLTAAPGFAREPLDRLRACGCGCAFLPHRPSQQFCSRRCAGKARARPAAAPRQRPAQPGPKFYLVLRLLKCQPLERRARGGWRFGAMTVRDSVVDRLIASGRAEIRGDRLHGKEAR